MTPAAAAPSARRDELLERAYRYALAHGLAGMSLRPLAEAIGSSPRVLLFLFGSKEDLIRALLARARQDELALLHAAHARGGGDGIAAGAARVWQWLSRSRAPRPAPALGGGLRPLPSGTRGGLGGLRRAHRAGLARRTRRAPTPRLPEHRSGRGRAQPGSRRATRRAARPACHRGPRPHDRRRPPAALRAPGTCSGYRGGCRPKAAIEEPPAAATQAAATQG